MAITSSDVSNASNSSAELVKSNAEHGTSDSKCSVLKKIKSPYLKNDKVQLLTSKVIEKRLVHKKAADGYQSSFPMAATIYRANSDEFKLTKRANKTVKKSVLTLPNKPTLKHELCTVSDMNDSEYFNRSDEERTRKTRKRPAQNIKRPHFRNKEEFEFYDRDARYCSQMNINLDSSSTDVIKDYKGDRQRLKPPHKSKNDVSPHDVWAILRNINQFQFNPSPPMSEDSIVAARKKRPINKKRKYRKDTRFIETCRTEEFSYIRNYDPDSPSCFSRSSSFDRVTVIDKQDEFTELRKAIQRRIGKPRNLLKSPNNARGQTKSKQINNKTKRPMKNNIKGTEKEVNSNQQLVPLNKTGNSANEGKKYIDNSKQIKNNENSVQFCHKDGDISSTPSGDCKALHLKVSGSSKAEFQNYANRKVSEKNSMKIVSSRESHPQINGITKVVLSKPEDTEAKGLRNKIVTIMPCTTPKLTQTDIKRRLAKMKFPIVVLGKDQLGCSSFHIDSFEHFQFKGLEEQVWPFMVKWYDDKANHGGNKLKIKSSEDHGYGAQVSPHSKSGNASPIKQILKKDKKCIDNSLNKVKFDPKQIITTHDGNLSVPSKPQKIRKPRPIQQFKDKMLKLIYKSSHTDNNAHNVQDAVVNEKPIKPPSITKLDASTETILDILYQPQADLKNRVMSPGSFGQFRKISNIRYPWAKVKRASDFIDNIIQKIKCGTYYVEENKVLSKTVIVAKEASIQTVLHMEITSLQEIHEDPLIGVPEVLINDNNESLTIIPGFDDTLPAIEIETMNSKQIAVRHCLTDVTIEFDVNFLENEPTLLEFVESRNFPPIIHTVNDSNSKVLKCKTSLFNSMLPAELCCILPKMMSDIKDLSNQLALPPIPPKNDLLIPTLAQLASSKNFATIGYQITPHSIATMKLLNGTFADIIANKCALKNSVVAIKGLASDGIMKDLFIEAKAIHSLFTFTMNPNSISITSKVKYNENDMLPQAYSQNCTAIQPYVPAFPIVTVTFNNIMWEKLWHEKIVVNLNVSYYQERINQLKKALTNRAYDTIANTGAQKVSLQIDSSFSAFSKFNDLVCELPKYRSPFVMNTDLSSTKCIEYVEPNEIARKTESSYCLSGVKIKRRSFVKLYRKCKSTTNISGERTSASLSKITTLEDFLRIFGTGKLLSTVFDGNAGKKILKSVAEMKNWITEINQRQAMLVLLLTNKKDTPNLVRFRPVLLQGIAVNRITRASELDMEIEVIERENINKLPLCEGISYLMPSKQNHDNLLEELYWIAKTTASDYQRPFDESSERLLKSLLEKRKKLNPSYLRVMARYVGLGLLKPQTRMY